MPDLPVSDLPTLGRALVRSADFRRRTDVAVPDAALLELPEKAVQFGTGAFLRGFVDFFVDEANRQGRFGGRVVAVGSTGSGRDRRLNEQSGLYTLAVRGMDGGAPRQEYRVIAAVSRALSARDEWGAVLACARNSALELVFSNTTEVGITLDEGDDVALEPPRSFPGKLARFLYERARAFDYAADAGVIVLPCELIEDNGGQLRETVLALAARGRLGGRFARWVESSVVFCNTLVDRIVPGAPGADEAERIQRALGYRDDLLTTCEVYRLFAVEGDDAVLARLGVADADPGIVIAHDIAAYRERKVRLLNGTHTVMAPAALLCGLATVREAIEHESMGRFVRRAMYEEIAPSLDAPSAEVYAREVLGRFANPFLRHALVDITLQETMKMRVRVVPSIVRVAERTGRAPASLAFGFAAYLLFMRGDVQAARRAGGLPVPADDLGERVRSLWSVLRGDGDDALASLARAACADASLWGTDLTRVPGFAESVAQYLAHACRAGVPAALEAHLAAGSAAPSA